MKKFFLIICMFFLITGCTKLNDLEYLDIVTRVLNSESNLSNQYRSGYKYYLPRGMRVKNSNEFNEVIENNNNVYYLYIDVINYYHQKKDEIKLNDNAYFSSTFKKGNFEGYLEIKEYESKYLIEIMYNYAKIEVIVDEKDISSTVFKAINILSSITYNKEIIDNYMGDNVLEFDEKDINIFETKEVSSNYLKAVEEYGYEEEVEIYDSDLLR